MGKLVAHRVTKWSAPWRGVYSVYTHPSRLIRSYAYFRLTAVLRMGKPEPSDTVVDLGFGTGFFLPTLSKTAGKVIGVDLGDQELCALAPQDFWTAPLRETTTLVNVAEELVSTELGEEDNVNLVRGDARNLPITSGIANKVFCLGLLEHVKQPEGVIREISRVLVQGGTAIFALPVEFSWSLAARSIVGLVLGTPRDDYTIRDLLASIMRSAPPSQEDRTSHTHRGYDYRQDLSLISDHFEIEDVRPFPLPLPGTRLLVLVRVRRPNVTSNSQPPDL